MTDAEFFAAAGRHFAIDKSENGGIIKSIMVDDVEIAVYGKEIDPAVTKIVKKYFAGNHDDYYVNNIYVKPIPKTKDGTPLMQTVAHPVGRMYETDIVLNEDLFRGATLEGLNKKMAQAKLNIAQTLEEAIIHEVGHAKTIYANRFSDIGKLYDKLEKMGVNGISKIADNDGAEAIAEIEILLHRGEKISDEAKTLYDAVMKGEL